MGASRPLRVGDLQRQCRLPHCVDLLWRQAKRCADLLDQRMIALKLRGIFLFDFSNGSLLFVRDGGDCRVNLCRQDAGGYKAKAQHPSR